MKLIIARHAQTDENAKGAQIGQESEALLNGQGLKQARQLAEFLKNETIQFAYVSPQKRAVYTAKEVLRFHPLVQVITAPHLREQHFGVFEGKEKAEWKALKKQLKEPFHLLKPQSGESYAELQARTVGFFNELLEKHENDTIFVMSHGGTLGMLYLHLFNKEITEENYNIYKPENTALTVLEIYKNNPIKASIVNSLKHLES